MEQKILDCYEPNHHADIINILQKYWHNLIWFKQDYVIYADKKYFFKQMIMVTKEDDSLGPVYKILDDTPLFAYKQTRIIPVACNFLINDSNELLIFNQTPMQVVKVISVKSVSEESLKKLVDNEYEKSKQAPHLDVKKPIVARNRSFMLLNRLPGVDGHHFYEASHQNKKPFPIKFILMFIDRLFHIYLLQVYAQKLAHLDIKPDNLVIMSEIALDKLPDYAADYTPEQLEINVVDFQFAACIGATLKLDRGSPGYLSPEFLNEIVVSSKPDVYALAVVATIISGLTIYSCDLPPRHNEKALTIALCERMYNALFSEVRSLFPYGVFVKFCILLSQMLKTSPEERWSIVQSCRALNHIINQLPNTDEIYNVSRKGLPSFDYTLYDIEPHSLTPVQDDGESVENSNTQQTTVANYNYPFPLNGLVWIWNIVSSMLRFGLVQTFVNYTSSPRLPTVPQQPPRQPARYKQLKDTSAAFTTLNSGFKFKYQVEISELTAAACPQPAFVLTSYSNNSIFSAESTSPKGWEMVPSGDLESGKFVKGSH